MRDEALTSTLIAYNAGGQKFELTKIVLYLRIPPLIPQFVNKWSILLSQKYSKF